MSAASSCGSRWKLPSNTASRGMPNHPKNARIDTSPHENFATEGSHAPLDRASASRGTKACSQERPAKRARNMSEQPTQQEDQANMYSTSSELAEALSVSRLSLSYSTVRVGMLTACHPQKVQMLKADFDDFRNLATCKICIRLLYEPYILSCGHTYCYSVRNTQRTCSTPR